MLTGIQRKKWFLKFITKIRLERPEEVEKLRGLRSHWCSHKKRPYNTFHMTRRSRVGLGQLTPSLERLTPSLGRQFTGRR